MWHWVKWLWSASYRELSRARSEHRRRALFRFFDGTDFVYRDPLLNEERLHCHPEFSFEKDLRLIELGDAAATQRMIQAAIDAFEIPVFDPKTQTGLTKFEILNVTCQYGDFITELKKNIGDLPMPPLDMESMPIASTEATTPPLSP